MIAWRAPYILVALAGNPVHCSQGARSATVICPFHMHVIQGIERYLTSTPVLLSADGRTGMHAVVLLLVIFYATNTDEHSGCVTSSGATTCPSYPEHAAKPPSVSHYLPWGHLW